MTVHLVGAGPGDPSLLTVAAAELIRRARVLVYDRPSMNAIVALAPEDAIKHVVGLAPGRKALPQPEVNALLIELARTHGEVVRLKAGDPFVASRGGEEALALQQAGIAVNVIPGVSAAFAAPAAAGIPVMLRQNSVTATIVSGDDDDEFAEPPDWHALGALGGTLVILTGRGHIRRISAALIEGGRAPETPIAAISGASRERQRVLRGTLGDLPAPLPPPVTFVVGTAAAMELTCTSPTAS
jgi:uroporphyrin-III C-methyltransferase